jgi:hypothetical protein
MARTVAGISRHLAVGFHQSIGSYLSYIESTSTISRQLTLTKSKMVCSCVTFMDKYIML